MLSNKRAAYDKGPSRREGLGWVRWACDNQPDRAFKSQASRSTALCSISPPRVAALLTVIVFALPAFSQGPANPPPPDTVPAGPNPFADFPKPSADFPTLPLDNAWPDRWGRAGNPIQGVIIDIDNPAAELHGSRPFMPFPAGDSPDAEALKKAALGNLKDPDSFLYEGLGAFTYSVVQPKGGEKPARRPQCAGDDLPLCLRSA